MSHGTGLVEEIQFQSQISVAFASIRVSLRKLSGMRGSRSLGQAFLVDPTLLEDSLLSVILLSIYEPQFLLFV